MKTFLIFLGLVTVFTFSSSHATYLSLKRSAISQSTRAPRAVTEAWEAYKLNLQSRGYTGISVHRFGNTRMDGQQVFYYLFYYMDPSGGVYEGSAYFNKNGVKVKSDP